MFILCWICLKAVFLFLHTHGLCFIWLGRKDGVTGFYEVLNFWLLNIVNLVGNKSTTHRFLGEEGVIDCTLPLSFSRIKAGPGVGKWELGLDPRYAAFQLLPPGCCCTLPCFPQGLPFCPSSVDTCCQCGLSFLGFEGQRCQGFRSWSVLRLPTGHAAFRSSCWDSVCEWVLQHPSPQVSSAKCRFCGAPTMSPSSRQWSCILGERCVCAARMCAHGCGWPVCPPLGQTFLVSSLSPCLTALVLTFFSLIPYIDWST